MFKTDPQISCSFFPKKVINITQKGAEKYKKEQIKYHFLSVVFPAFSYSQIQYRGKEK